MCCGSYCFVADVNPVHFDSRTASKSASEGNGRIAYLGRVEIRAILDLHSWLELRQIKEVPAVDRQILDLLAAQYSLDARLLGVYLLGASLYFDHLVFLADLKRGIECGGVSHLHVH